MTEIQDHSQFLVDASGYRGQAERVFAPETEAEVGEILRDASRCATPVTIAGAGTGLTGGRVPEGGWVVSLHRLRDLNVRAGAATCGAGVLLHDLQLKAAESRQFYPPDPTENSASIGGTLATNASGSRSFLYGASRRWVEGIRVILIDGEVLALRRGEKPPFPLPVLAPPASTKNTAGYWLRPGMDYLDLFIGSEGTLGAIVEADLKLLPAPAELTAAVLFFESDEGALDAVDAWRSVAGMRMLEYLDAGSLDLLRTKFQEIPQTARAAVLAECEGDQWTPDHGMPVSWAAAGAKDRERFRQFRHALPEAVNDLVRRRGVMKMGSDFAVPVSRNREMLAFYRALLDGEFPGQYAMFGHIGDAHVHVNILPTDRDEWDRARNLMSRFARRAVEFGGTVSAEHGLGKSKRHFLALQFTPDEIKAIKGVKRTLDPGWLLGRGTLFPAP